jgi:hypothetical protein
MVLPITLWEGERAIGEQWLLAFFSCEGDKCEPIM